MSRAYFSFVGRLNDFLPRAQRGKLISIDFRERQSVKHLAESLGVPHPEIGAVQVNGQERALDTITQDEDRVALHPIPDGCPVEPRFVLDGHLGRLAAYLRMLGFDCLYENDPDDKDLAEIAQREGRILLSRDRRLLMRKAVTHGYCLRSLDPFEQLSETIRRFDLAKRIVPFHRCLRCNHSLEPVAKEAVLDRLEPLTKLYFDEFQTCPACKQIYWKGSHFEKMKGLVEQLAKSQGLSLG
ncbi:MAG: Mut7-C RNAse domain-containing protein [Chloroflexota bacterium]